MIEKNISVLGWKQNNLLLILGNSQIIPNRQPYSRTQIYGAVSARTGKTPAVRCNCNYWTGIQQFQETGLCFNLNATAFLLTAL